MEVHQYIPEQYRVGCTYCALQLDTRHHRTYQRCTGWALNRQAGSTGNLFMLERSREWACRWCLEERRKKGTERRPGGLALCTWDCGTKVDKLKLGSYQLCTGWVSGNLGSGGKSGSGRNTVANRERLDSFACGECMKRRLQGISLDQGTLW